MQINVNSWHYRLIRNTFNSRSKVPNSLCPYVRALMYRLVFFGFGITMVLGFLAIFGYGIIIECTYLVELLGFSNGATLYELFVSLIAGAIFFSALLAATIGIIFGGSKASNVTYKYIKEKCSRINDSTVKKVTKSDNIAWNYLRAKHNKICPQIKFIRD